MGLCKKDVTPVLTHWSYVFLALTRRCCNRSLALVATWPWTAGVGLFNRCVQNLPWHNEWIPVLTLLIHWPVLLLLYLDVETMPSPVPSYWRCLDEIGEIKFPMTYIVSLIIRFRISQLIGLFWSIGIAFVSFVSFRIHDRQSNNWQMLPIIVWWDWKYSCVFDKFCPRCLNLFWSWLSSKAGVFFTQRHVLGHGQTMCFKKHWSLGMNK